MGVNDDNHQAVLLMLKGIEEMNGNVDVNIEAF